MLALCWEIEEGNGSDGDWGGEWQSSGFGEGWGMAVLGDWLLGGGWQIGSWQSWGLEREWMLTVLLVGRRVGRSCFILQASYLGTACCLRNFQQRVSPKPELEGCRNGIDISMYLQGRTVWDSPESASLSVLNAAKLF